MEFATKAGRERPVASTQPPSAAASAPRVVRPGSGLALPLPRQIRCERRERGREERGRAEACTSPRRRSREQHDRRAVADGSRMDSRPGDVAPQRPRREAKAGLVPASLPSIAERRRRASPDSDEDGKTRGGYPAAMDRPSTPRLSLRGTRLVGGQERGRERPGRRRGARRRRRRARGPRVDRMLLSDDRVTSAAEGKRLLAGQKRTRGLPATFSGSSCSPCPSSADSCAARDSRRCRG